MWTKTGAVFVDKLGEKEQNYFWESNCWSQETETPELLSPICIKILSHFELAKNKNTMFYLNGLKNCSIQLENIYFFYLTR